MIDARAKAVAIANGNFVHGAFQLGPEHVELGHWDGEDFHPLEPLSNDDLLKLDPQDPVIVDTNALRVKATYEGITAVFASALWGASLNTTNSAIAFRKPQGGVARTVPCMLPLAIPDCAYVGSGGQFETPSSNPDPIKFIMTNDNIDNVGWGNPFSSGYGTKDIIEAMQTGGCYDSGVAIGDPMYAKNGQNTPVIDAVGEMLNGNFKGFTPDDFDDTNTSIPARDGIHANCPEGYYLSESQQKCVDPPGQPKIGSLVPSPNGNVPHDQWPHSVNGKRLPRVIQGPVALVTPEDCNDPSFTGELPISGFAWAMIFDAQSKASKSDGTETEAPNIWVQLDFITERDVGGDIQEGIEGPIKGYAKPQLVY